MEEMEIDLNHPEEPTFSDTLAALKNRQHPATSRAIYYGLSNLSTGHRAQVKLIWDALPPDYRHNLVEALVEATETDFELDYRDFGLFAIRDTHATVRAAAVELFWEDETLEVMRELTRLVEWDEDASVRAAAAKALSHFILQGELGNLPENAIIQTQDVLIGTFNDHDEDTPVRRRALEAISNCSHEAVNDLIRDAYDSQDSELMLGAVFAMGRSCDAQWSDTVIRELRSDDPEMVFEAARAAGELELDETISILGRLAISPDREIQEIAIWSLGEIGGREALRILNALAEDAEDAGDDALIDSIEDAIGSGSIAGDLFDVDIDE